MKIMNIFIINLYLIIIATLRNAINNIANPYAFWLNIHVCILLTGVLFIFESINRFTENDKN